MKSVMIFLANYFYIFLLIAVFFVFALIGYFMDKKVKDAQELHKEKTETIKVNDNVETLKEENNTTLNEELVNNLNVSQETKSETISEQPNVEVAKEEAPTAAKVEEKVDPTSNEQVVQVPSSDGADQIEIL